MASAKRNAVTRRRLLMMGGAGGLGALAAPGLAGAASPADRDSAGAGEWLSGVLERVEGRDAIYVTTRNGPAAVVRVELMPGAQVLRDGKAALGDFEPGEEISAAGAYASDGSFRSHSVEAVYRIVEATVTDANGQRIETEDDGTIGVTRKTRPRGGGALGHELDAAEPQTLDAGDRIVVAGRKVPHSSRINANRVGLISD